MINYIIRRILLMFPTLIGMTFIIFAVIRMAPGLTTAGGTFAPGMLGAHQAQLAEKQFMERRLHLVNREGKPIPLVIQYFDWLGRIANGDLGTSIKFSEPVTKLVLQRLPVTLVINAISLVIIYLVAVPGGMLAAVYHGRFIDRAFGIGSLVLYSLPIIWVGSMAIGFLANPEYLNWFPSAGLHATNTSHMSYFQYVSDYAWHITLPVLCLSYGGFAYLAKQVRGSYLENLFTDFTRTARAKGLPPSAVLLRHVTQNSLLPMITIIGMTVPGLLGGSVIVEKIFSIEGMGRLMYQATYARDLPVIQSMALVSAAITLFSYLLVDIAYHAVDPRVTYD